MLVLVYTVAQREEGEARSHLQLTERYASFVCALENQGTYICGYDTEARLEEVFPGTYDPSVACVSTILHCAHISLDIERVEERERGREKARQL